MLKLTSIKILEPLYNEFKMIFKIENIKLLSGNYNVEISSKGIAHFSYENSNLQYWIATDQKHSYYNG